MVQEVAVHVAEPDVISFAAKNKRMRLHFNKVGYQIYGKEQSRRVPAVRAKPGNPGKNIISDL